MNKLLCPLAPTGRYELIAYSKTKRRKIDQQQGVVVAMKQA
jgi:hypothetical protein